MHDAWRVAVALPLGAVAFVSLGVLLGSVLPSARAAQAVGLLLFFPSFLLGAGGPPPHVMGSVVRSVAGPLPLTLVTDAVRAPWLGLGSATGSLIGGDGARGGGHGRRGPPLRAVTPALPRYGRPATGGRTIRAMSGDLDPGGPAELAPPDSPSLGLTESLAGRARWASIVVFAAVTAAGAVWLDPSAPVAVAGAVVAIGAAVPLVLGSAARADRTPRSPRPGSPCSGTACRAISAGSGCAC